MDKKLPWEEIVGLYDNQWVELVDCDWPEEEIDPRAGVVRVHAKTRGEFNALVAKLPLVDSAFVFVGEPKIPHDVIVSTFNTITIDRTKNA